MRTKALVAIAAILLLTAALLPSGSTRSAGVGQTPANFKVAFIGDLGISSNAVAVLNLISAEGADMVIHLGDLGYGNETDPQRAIDWDAQVTGVLGADYPYFGVTGNHDVGNWATYQGLLEDRLALVSGASCSGDYGVMAVCTYQGLFFILSGAGSQPNQADYQPHIDYISDQLALDDSLWRICAWHKNQNAMQLGTKTNEVGWGPYEACRQNRAIIATAHEHSYSRTRTLTNTQTQTADPVWTDPNTVRVGGGSTFAFVSGLGGQSIRKQDRCLPTTPPYGCNGEWASISTSDQAANYGAMFLEFHVDGDPTRGTGYFKEIDGDIIDTFTVYSKPAMLPPPTQTPTPTNTPTVTPTWTPKNPAGDTDGDTVSNDTDPDDDNDGCLDTAEESFNENLGGRRSPHYFWDFYDVWTHPAGQPTMWERNKVLNVFDILAVASRFGLGPTLSKQDALDAALTAPTDDSSYHPAYDRGPVIGANNWDRAPPDGSINIVDDILGIAQQFGHDCT